MTARCREVASRHDQEFAQRAIAPAKPVFVPVTQFLAVNDDVASDLRSIHESSGRPNERPNEQEIKLEGRIIGVGESYLQTFN